MYLTKIIQGLVPIVYSVLEAELLVYLTKFIQGLMARCVQCVGSRALGVSDQDYPMAGGLLCVGGRALVVSDLNYHKLRAGGLLCTVC